MSERITPMLGQYRSLKARYPDALLLFRLGDFYEMFEEDARTGARELGLYLTTRSFGKGVRLPMCGLPHQHVTNYIARLLERGYKVALVEQLEDPKKVRRLVKRDVVRVITPGTVVEDALLRDVPQNFLAAIAIPDEGRRTEDRTPSVLRPPPSVSYGLALVDLSTGEFIATQTDGPGAWNALLEELEWARPSEYVLPPRLMGDATMVAQLRAIRPARLSPLQEAHFRYEAARAVLLAHFGVASLEAYGCEELPGAVMAAGAALSYLKANQVSTLAHLRSLTTYSPADYMRLDPVSRRNLELTETLRDRSVQGSLLGVLDYAKTAMGRRLLRRWITQPLLDPARIGERLDAVEELVTNAFLRADLRALLDGLYDMERLVGRIGFGNANARDLVALKKSLVRLPRLKALLAQARSARLRHLQATLDELQDVADLIARAIVDDPPFLLREGGLIRPGYHPELDELHRRVAAGKDGLAELEARERARTGIKNLRVRYNEIFGFFIEVPRSAARLVPPDYERRATITHAERYVTPELKAQEAHILDAEERSQALEYELFVQVRQHVAEHALRLLTAGHILAEVDTLASLAEAAARHSYVRPEVDDGLRIDIVQGRHPVVERTLPEGERFVPNDAHLDGEARMLVITGPNMSGKSVYIRQVALIALMAQMGSFVPAASARIGLADRIFVRAGASDDITQGRSTFLVEMSETGYILRHATSRSLIVLDEVGRGTSTYDGVSIAWAVAEFIHDALAARTLFATHYHELTRLAEHLEGVRNLTMAIAERGQEIIFLRQVIPGGADKSYGIHVARLAGLPEPVVQRAWAVLQELEGQQTEHQGPSSALRPSSSVRDLTADYRPQMPDAWTEVLRELFALDIANLTPVQALVALNELQQRLRQGGSGL